VITPKQRNVALLVAGCFFMENLDGTIVTTAAPSLAAALGVPVGAISSVITAYLVTLAVLIPVSGWMARRFGTRRIFLIAIVVFTLASLGCAFSANLSMLVIMRVLQGAGGAMMVPVGRVAVFTGAAKQDLIRIVAFITWPALVAPVMAPLLGGILATYASWRWIFLINVPLGAVALLVASRLITDADHPRPGPLDWVGMLLTAAGFGGLAFSAHLIAEEPGWIGYAALAAAIVLTLMAVWHLLGTTHPLLNLQVLRISTLRFFVTTGSLYWVVVGAIPFLTPLLFQQGFGWSPVMSGAVVLLIFVGNIAIKPATTPLLNRFGFRPTLLVAAGVLVLTTVGIGLVSASTSLVVIGALVLVSGVARSTGLTVFNTIGVSDVEPADIPDANAVMATSQQLCSAFGVAVATIALHAGSLLEVSALGPLAPYRFAYGLLAVAGLLAFVGAARLDPDAGRALRRVSAKAR